MRCADRGTRTRAALAAGVLAVVVAPSACGGPHNAQYILHIDTDAPLPIEPGGVLLPGDPKPLFDRLSINTFSCTTDCSRVFALDRSMFAGDAMPTFGLYSPGPTGSREVNILLYRAAGTSSNGPQPNATIGGYLTLPALAPSATEKDLYVQLKIADIGTSVCTSAGCTAKPVPIYDAPQPKLRPWKLAYPAPCAGTPGAGEVCVPAGAFWMGNMLDVDFDYQMLAAVSPFYIDATEVTVGAFRASGLAVIDSRTGHSTDPSEHQDDLSTSAGECTFTAASAGADADAVALNCVSFSQAQAYCQSLGKDLPTWEEFEFVAGDRTSQLYPWGLDEPACADAVFGRATAIGTSSSLSSECLRSDSPLRPLQPMSALRDRVVLPGGAVYDLGGNLAEWVQDYASSSEPCTSTNPLVDFVCTDAKSTMGLRATKGGTWFEPAFAMRAANVGTDSPTSRVPGIGFRCARRAVP